MLSIDSIKMDNLFTFYPGYFMVTPDLLKWVL